MNVKPVVWGSPTRKAAAPVGDCLTGTTGWLTATYDVTMPPELADHLSVEPVLPQNAGAYKIDVRGHLDQEVEHCVVGVQDTTLTFKYAGTYGVRKVKVTFPFDALFPYPGPSGEGVHCPCRDALSKAACTSLRNAGNCEQEATPANGYKGKARVFAASPPSGGLCSRGRPRVRRPRSTLERLSRRSVPR